MPWLQSVSRSFCRSYPSYRVGAVLIRKSKILKNYLYRKCGPFTQSACQALIPPSLLILKNELQIRDRGSFSLFLISEGSLNPCPYLPTGLPST